MSKEEQSQESVLARKHRNVTVDYQDTALDEIDWAISLLNPIN